MEEANAGQVRFDGFVLKLLLSKKADELAEDCLCSREVLIGIAGAEFRVPVVA